MARLAALLRGINVGGHHLVPMAQLTVRLEGVGLRQVQTLLNSGNVVFEAGRLSPARLEARLAALLHDWLGFEVAVMLRTLAQLEVLWGHRPAPAPPEVKDYAAFLQVEPRAVTLPLRSEKDGVEISRVVGRDALLRLTPIKGRYASSLAFAEKALGSALTTRNWNTVEKVMRALDS